MRGSIGFLLGVLLAAGCGGATPISSQPLSGKVGGQAWTFATGETNPSLSTGDQLWVELYAATFDTCVAFGAPMDADEIIMMLPKTPGTYELSFSLNATFYVSSSSSNLVATRGTLQIDSVTATTIGGGMRIAYNGDNSVEGQFTAAICP
jgi:hypothetical protein